MFSKASSSIATDIAINAYVIYSVRCNFAHVDAACLFFFLFILSRNVLYSECMIGGISVPQSI